jgi:PKD repeat protein
MGLEVTTNIAGLVDTNPATTDPVYDGPRHFWLIKSVLKNIFPGVGGQGFAIPITATEAELNYLGGVTSNVQTQIDTANSEIGDINADIAALEAKTLHVLLADGSTTVNVPLA